MQECGEAINQLTGLLRVFKNESAQAVEGVEEEVRINLLAEDSKARIVGEHLRASW